MHWASKYIGTPWESGARGPDKFDCWGLVYWVYLNELEIELEAFHGVNAKDTLRVIREIKANKDDQHFKEVRTPAELDVVLMARNEVPHHVGLYIHGEMIVHCQDGIGVNASTLSHIKALGYNNLTYYRWSR